MSVYVFGMTHTSVWEGWGGLRSSVRGEVGLACSHVRGRPILPAAPKLLLVYLLGVRKHQGFTGVEDREHGELPKSLWEFRHGTHGSDRRDGTGLTGLISMYVFGMTHTPVGGGGGARS